MADEQQYTDAQLSDGTTLRFKGSLSPDEVRTKVTAFKATRRDKLNSTETDFEQQNKMGPVGRQLTSLGLGAASGASGLPETMEPVTDALSGGAPPKTLKDAITQGLSSGLGIGPALYSAGKQILSPSGSGDDAAEERAHGFGTLAGMGSTALVGEGVNRGMGLRGAISRSAYTPEGVPKPGLQSLGEALQHPTTIPGKLISGVAKKAFPPPPTYPGASLPLAEDFYANKAEDLMTRQAQQDALDKQFMSQGKAVPLSQSPNLLANKADYMLGKSTPLSESPNASINAAKANPDALDEIYGPQVNAVSSDPYAPPSGPQDLISRTRRLVLPGEEPSPADLKRAGDLTQAPLPRLQQLAKFGDKLAQNEINRRLRNQ